MNMTRRERMALVALPAVALAALTIGLLQGELGGLSELVSAWNTGDTELIRLISLWRAPRVAVIIAVGLGLGAAGAMMQVVTQNPLGSPDVIGMTSGSSLGAVIALAHYPSSGYAAVAIGALLGGAASAAVVLSVSWRRESGAMQLILTGIAVSALFTSVATWVALRGGIDTAMSIAAWGVGSLSQVTWAIAVPTAAALFPLVVAALLTDRVLRQVALGEEVAVSTGVNVLMNRRLVATLSVGLTAISTAAVGPIAFVALLAPRIWASVSRRPPTVWGSALGGVVLLAVADIVAREAFSVSIPVGTVTLAGGGLYLVAYVARTKAMR